MMAHIRQLADTGSIPVFATKTGPQIKRFEDFFILSKILLRI
jgi:hypothetical protein